VQVFPAWLFRHFEKGVGREFDLGCGCGAGRKEVWLGKFHAGKIEDSFAVWEMMG
jgi:hypothetical protein